MHERSAENASWFDAPLDEWLSEYQTTTLHAVALVQALVPGMCEREPADRLRDYARRNRTLHVTIRAWIPSLSFASSRRSKRSYWRRS